VLSKTKFPPRTPKNEKLFIYFADNLLLRNIKVKSLMELVFSKIIEKVGSILLFTTLTITMGV
jgi:hypothetical protein